VSEKTPESCDRCGNFLADSGYFFLEDKDGNKEYMCPTCRRKHIEDWYEEQRQLNSAVTMHAAIHRDWEHADEINQAVEEIMTAIKKFEERQWFPKLKDYYNESTSRGHKDLIPAGKIMMWGCAGRVMFTIEDSGGSWISTMVSDDDKTSTMGLHALYGTKEEILSLLDRATKTILDFHPDEEVGIGL